MKLSQILLKQHIGRHFKAHWRVQGVRKPVKTAAEEVLKRKGIPVYKAEDLLNERPSHSTHERIEVVGMKPKPVKFDETHPNWHVKPLLTYKDNNVLLEGLTQAKIITNTVELKDGLPEQISLNDAPKTIHDKVKKIIYGSHCFDAEQVKLPKIKDPERPAWNFPRVYGISENRVNKLLISKLLQLIESASDIDVVKNRYLLNDLYFSLPLKKYDSLLQMQLSGDTLLTSKKPMRPITNVSTANIELPDIFPVKPTVTLNEENIYEISNIYPINSTTQFHHPHTLFIHYNQTEVKNLYEEEVTEPQIHGRSLMKTFTVAASYARQKFGKEVKDLPQPVSLQCVQTNGKWFHFGVFQLNSLDLEQSNSKNIWYQTDSINLFDKCCYDLGKPILEGYNKTVINQLLSLYNNM